MQPLFSHPLVCCNALLYWSIPNLTRCLYSLKQVKRDPQLCQGCHPRLQNRTNLKFRYSNHSIDLRRLRAENSLLKKMVPVQDPMGAQPNAAATGDHENQLHRTAGRQQNHGDNNVNQAPPRPTGRPHRPNGYIGKLLDRPPVGGQPYHANQAPVAAAGQRRHGDHGNQLYGAMAGQYHYGNNRNQAFEFPAGQQQQLHGNNYNQFYGAAGGQQYHYGNGQFHGAAGGQQQPHGNKHNQFYGATGGQQQPHGNNEKLVFNLVQGQHHHDNALFNHTMNCVLFPNADEPWNPRVLKVKFLRNFADWSNPNITNREAAPPDLGRYIIP